MKRPRPSTCPYPQHPGFAIVANDETGNRPKYWFGWLLSAAVLLSVVVVLYNRSQIVTGLTTVKIEKTGRAHIGSLSLQNKTVRGVALKVMAHLNGGRATLRVDKSARLRDVGEMSDSMRKAGITCFVSPRRSPQEH